MNRLMNFLLENKHRLVSFEEIEQSIGLSESEVLSLINKAKVMFNFEPKFRFAEEEAVIMIGNTLPVKRYLGIG